jgi:tyrocidine synthetase-3
VPELLDVERLHAALELVVSRHPALRSSFETVWTDDQVRIDDRLPVPAVRMHRLAVTSSAQAIAEVCGELANAPFRLDEEALIRADIVATGSKGCILVLAVEHLVCDGYSYSTLLNECMEAYDGGALPERESTYPQVMDDRARREREEVAEPLAGQPVLPVFPWAHPAPSGRRSFDAASVTLVVPGIAKNSFVETAMSGGVPVATLCLTALAQSIQDRLPGEDFSALLIVLNRDVDNVDVTGWFSNSVEIRIPPFVEGSDEASQVDAVQAVIGSCMARQGEVIYERIRRFQPDEYGQIPETPMFSVNCQVPFSTDDLSPSGLTELPLRDAGWAVGVELNFGWNEDSLEISAAYNVSTIDPETLTSLLGDVASRLALLQHAME